MASGTTLCRSPFSSSRRSHAATQALLREYASAPSEVIAVDPVGFGAGKIAYFGFFREQFRKTSWRDAGDWLGASPQG